MAEQGHETTPSGDASSSLFSLRRATFKNGQWYLIWHDYKTAETRDKWAAIYRERGDRVDVNDG